MLPRQFRARKIDRPRRGACHLVGHPERTDRNHVERTDGPDADEIEQHIGRLHRNRRIRIAAATVAALLLLIALSQDGPADGERHGADEHLFDAFIGDATP